MVNVRSDAERCLCYLRYLCIFRDDSTSRSSSSSSLGWAWMYFGMSILVLGKDKSRNTLRRGAISTISVDLSRPAECLSHSYEYDVVSAGGEPSRL